MACLAQMGGSVFSDLGPGPLTPLPCVTALSQAGRLPASPKLLSAPGPFHLLCTLQDIVGSQILAEDTSRV